MSTTQTASEEIKWLRCWYTNDFIRRAVRSEVEWFSAAAANWYDREPFITVDVDERAYDGRTMRVYVDVAPECKECFRGIASYGECESCEGTGVDRGDSVPTRSTAHTLTEVTNGH